MDFNFSTPNLAQYEQHLLNMGTKAARAAGRKALRQGINVTLAETRMLATSGHPAFPNRITGRLVKALYTHDRGISGDTILFSVDLRASAFYGKFVEFGTSHSRAYPFMRPGAENTAVQAVNTIASVLSVEIQSYWNKADM